MQRLVRNRAAGSGVSIQESFADVAAEAVRRGPDSLASCIELLSAEADLVAANSNTNWAHKSAKRFLDLAIAIPALIFLAPLLAILALSIRLDSPGPALFRQKRLGYRSRPFDILKFRTMKVLEDGEAVIQARPGDARTTRVGRWLRAYSLDELPQFINVVKGEMSLVGPRPHACAHDEFYGRVIADYRRRQDVKPGMTGWAQVHGLRGATPTLGSMTRRVDFDVWYAEHASFALDAKILLRTPMEVVRRRNAY
jgi:putative colanic acid biosynthesis UDP-glucose lipid carrier transferase